MEFYQFSEYGRQVTYGTWRSIGGCALPNNTMAMAHKDSTLGDIDNQCAFSGRCLARYAAETLEIYCFVEEIP